MHVDVSRETRVNYPRINTGAFCFNGFDERDKTTKAHLAVVIGTLATFRPLEWQLLSLTKGR